MNFQRLDQLCEIRRGTSITQKSISVGNIPVIAGGRKPAYFHNLSNRTGKTITISSSGAYAGFVNYFDYPIFASDCFTIKSENENKICTKYIFFYLKSKQEQIYSLQTGAGQPHVYPKDLISFQIPTIPIKEQLRIIEVLEEIDNLRQKQYKALELTRQMIPALFYEMIEREECTWHTLENICSFEYGLTASAQEKGNVRFVRITDIKENGRLESHTQKFIDLGPNDSRYLLKNQDVLVARTGATYGKTVIFEENYPAIFASYLIRLNLDLNKITPYYYWLFTQTEKYWQQARSLVNGTGQPQFNSNAIKQIQVPIPSINIQNKIIANLQQILILEDYQCRSQQKFNLLFDSTQNHLFS